MQRILLPFLLLALLSGAATPFARAATSTSSTSPSSTSTSSTSPLAISQVYAGGGNAGASYQNDFVELVNRGAAAVDLSGWTLQYAPASGTSWQVTALGGSLGSGRYYLVQLASSATIGAPLPAPEATGTTNLAATGGKLALVHGTTALTCGAAVGSCSSVSTVGDLVGYGTATDYEGAGAAPGLDSTTSAIRTGSGCTDTDSNSADFAAVAPVPRNGSTPAASCGGAVVSAGSQGASVDVDVQPAIAISLERPSISFGTAVAGSTPLPVSERVSVTSNHAAGYALSVHRSAFAPSDLPLGLAASAPAGGTLGGGLGGTLAALPVAPAVDLLIGTTAAASPAAGDVWPVSIGFASPLPAVAPGHYTATVTFTVVGR